MRMQTLCYMAILLAFAQNASARNGAISTCTMQENVNLSLNFSGAGTSVKEVREALERHVQKVEEQAKQAKVEKITLQSQNYSISSNDHGHNSGGYQYQGSVAFTLGPQDKAADLLELLDKNGIKASLNVNMYKSGSCQ